MKFSEVHLHLEGCVYEEALKKINKRRFIKYYKKIKSKNKNDFFKIMNHISSEILACKRDYLDTFETLCNQLSETHEYVELTISPRAYDFYHEGDFEDILYELSNKAKKESRLKVNFLIDLLRNSGVDKCWKYLDFANKLHNNLNNVVGINLAGDEIKYPMKSYIQHIKKAKEYGLFTTIHSGEWGESDQVWCAIEAGADRIGHGIRSVDDASLLDKLSKENIPLEICPSSNLYTGASEDLREIKKLAEKGINLMINTDDPAVFNTSLKKELEIFRNITADYKFKSPYLFRRD